MYSRVCSGENAGSGKHGVSAYDIVAYVLILCSLAFSLGKMVSGQVTTNAHLLRANRLEVTKSQLFE